MKIKLLPLSICLSLGIVTHAQSIDVINKNLAASLNRIGYWSDNAAKDNYDSLGNANDKFEALLLKYTKANPETLTTNFKNLLDNGLTIKTAPDNNFRIYTWDDMSGGSMRYFRNVFQYKSGGKVYSKVIKDPVSEDNNPDMGSHYSAVNTVTSNGKTYYVTQSVAIGSSALYSYTIKIFSIDNNQLNDKAKLIQTKSGLHNTLTYDVDWSDNSNRSSTLDREAGNPGYDVKNNIISIPLIQADGRVTTKRIQYKFNCQYFVKI